ncbi:1-phosphofructokinase family hexose kinase [Rhodoligotrophos defluvii]|uniref:1-phosphofructokinase family hexose kinase n=1 Tax=Rhodoligotrophos defluvii TaxID=2561934 RepID=UPI0010CA0D88|nr:1-phosphofructokinase family hexose kinase [Rhodoligotrophos defluvii]
MKPIVTLTLNPSIDGAAQTHVVRPIRKIRTSDERYDPGGGGINVARVVQELGGTAFATYLAGGATGRVLDDLLESAAIMRRRISIDDHTRISHAVYERSSGLEYRFVPEGPVVREAEWRACLEALEDLDCDYLVASGSLPRGIPEDFYAIIADRADRNGFKLVLDTSGAALRRALERGVHLVKPNLGEFESMRGRKLPNPALQEEAARELVRSGAAEIVALTLGRDGALLVSDQSVLRLAAPDVTVKSAVGAGDSFVAAMTLGLARERPVADAFAYGMAAGAAAVLSAGTGLCRREDVERLYGEIKMNLPQPR